MIGSMGVAESPLRDRVIFVQGAPRSGTTWLVMLLATHPQIAGVEAESHLFEFGVDHLFDNFEGRDPNLRGLRTYLEREQLVDLVRDVCDGVFERMAENVNAADSDFFVEKTPTSNARAALDLQRKRECYPDGRYLHIVRDGDAVTRSLMSAPWMPDRSEAACRQLWDDCVSNTRAALGDHPHYREVSFEELAADPRRVGADLFEWLGIDSGASTLDAVGALSRERFSELGAVAEEPSAPVGIRGRARRAKQLTHRAIARVRRDDSPAATDPNSDLSFKFVRALRERDSEAIRSMTAESVALTFRSPAGDLCLRGDEARDQLCDIGRTLFESRHISESWSSAPGGPREWWTRAPGQPFWAIFFSGIGGNATRVDVAFGLTPKNGLIEEVMIFSTGALTGRPLRQLIEA